MANDDVTPLAAPAESLPALRHLLAEVTAGNPFYQRRLADLADGGRSVDSIADFSARFPFTTKRDLVEDQALHPPYGSDLTHPLDRYTRCHQTSGTTGAPLRWLDTPESWSAMTDDWTTVLQASGVERGDRAFFAFSFGPFLGFWLAFEAAGRMGVFAVAGGGMSSAQRLRVLREQACTVLCCTPTYALHLAETARNEGFQPSDFRVRRILVAGEPGGSIPAVRQRIAEAWNGAHVSDHHGMTETGPVTHEDPRHPGHLVVMERSFLAEVVDPETLSAVAPGAPGELILTTLRRAASPLIRYRTGDLVRARRIGGRLVLEGGILGRVDDMIVVRGVNVYPSALDALVREAGGVGEYRVTVDRRQPLLELAIEVEAGEAEARAVAARIQESLALRVPVTSVAAGSLPRFELKARRWRNLGA
jgi:phenylacetate-CoA ligase